MESLEHFSDQRRRLVESVHKWGNSAAEALLDPSCKIFSVKEIDGLIGYHGNAKCAVVFGDPVCAHADRPKLAKAFHQFCENKKKNIIYLVASEDFARWMRENEKGALIEFGEELFLDPQCDPQTKSGKKGILLRGKVRQAAREGVVVKEYHNDIPVLEEKLTDIATQWLKHRRGPQIYISRVRLFAERFGKRWFYAEQNDELIGLLVLNQLQIRQGWVVDRVMTVPNAPPGTSELLVVSILENLAKEGCRFVTFGATPAEIVGEVLGFGKCTAFMARTVYSLCKKIYHLEGKKKYWEKFHPKSAPTFAIFKTPRFGLSELRGLMQALNVF